MIDGKHKLVIYYDHYKSLWYCSHMTEVHKFTAMLDDAGVVYKFYPADSTDVHEPINKLPARKVWS